MDAKRDFYRLTLATGSALWAFCDRNSGRWFPRLLSQHVGGMVITRGRIDELPPLENAAMLGARFSNGARGSPS